MSSTRDPLRLGSSIDFRSKRTIILAVIFCSAVVTLAAQFGLPVGWLTIPAGLVMSFFGPGFVALLAFRPRPITTLDLVISVPLTFAAAICLSVLIDFTGIGLHLQPIAIGLALLTLVFLAIALWRGRAGSGTGDWRHLARRETVRPWAANISTAQMLLRASLIGALVVATLWAIFGFLQAAQDRPPIYTELYVEQAQTVTPNSTTPTQAELLIGVNNHEAQVITYTLQVINHTASGPDVPLSQQAVTVKAGGNWQGRVAAQVLCGDNVEAQLFLPNTAQPYRSVHARFSCDSKLTSTPVPTETK